MRVYLSLIIILDSNLELDPFFIWCQIQIKHIGSMSHPDLIHQDGFRFRYTRVPGQDLTHLHPYSNQTEIFVWQGTKFLFEKIISLDVVGLRSKKVIVNYLWSTFIVNYRTQKTKSSNANLFICYINELSSKVHFFHLTSERHFSSKFFLKS